MSKPKAIVTGMIANFPLGGVSWDYAQYALGLERLGFDVYYLEDSGLPPYDPKQQDFGNDCSFAVKYLQDTLNVLSPALAKRWRFVNVDGQVSGLDEGKFREVLKTSVLFLNVSGSAVMRDEYLETSNRVFVDTDPGLNHFHAFPQADSGHVFKDTHGWRAHDTFFTYALNINDPQCQLNNFGVDWHPTVPLVVRDCWARGETAGLGWTTIMSWNGMRVPVKHDGRSYGGKEWEFEKIERLPSRMSVPFEIAVGGNSAPRERLACLGWSVRDSHDISEDVDRYREFIIRSRGEFSVAKNIYVDTHCGWFSCRTVCYLAAGRPAVVQDTGFSRVIPCNEGLFAFHDEASAESAIKEVECNYARHARAATSLAAEYFDHKVVLHDLLEKAGVPIPV